MAVTIEALDGVEIDQLNGCSPLGMYEIDQLNAAERLQLLGPDIMGLGAATLTDAEIQAMATDLAPHTAIGGGLVASDLAKLFMNYDRETQLKLGAAIIAAGGNADKVGNALDFASRGADGPFKRNKTAWTIWSILSTASAAASAYHGYKRNESVGWAIAWFILGGFFPVITPAVALAQGFGQPKR